MATGFARLCIAGILAVFLAGAVLAQAQGEPDYTSWEQVVARVDSALDSNRASDAALTELRAEVVGWRERFLQSESLNSGRIETLNRQIESLGPAPAEGETEPEDIAARRKALGDELAAARAPGVKATEAYTQADGLVREIDGYLRDRQARETFRRLPIPINLLNWAPVLDELKLTVSNLATETVGKFRAEDARQDFLRELPRTLALLIGGLFLLLRITPWSSGLLRVSAKTRKPARRMLFGSAIFLLHMACQWGALVLIARAIQGSGLVGFMGETLVETLPLASLVWIVGMGLVQLFFPRTVRTDAIISPAQADAARWMARATVWVLTVYAVTYLFMQLMELSSRTVSYVNFVIAIPAALLLFFLGQILSRPEGNGEPVAADGDQSFALRRHVVIYLGRAARGIAVLGLVAGFLGYLNLADAAIIPAIITLAIFGVIVAMQDLLSRIYSSMRTGRDVPPEGLLPIFIGIVLALLSLPVLALTWGARVTDLTEVWARLREGVMLGGTRISPGVFLTLIVVFVIGLLMTRLIQTALRTSILPKTKLDRGAQNAILSGIGYVGVFLATIFAITTAGINLSSLAIVAGALSVGIGFGLQNIVSNFVSGIILLAERPVSEGDWIEVGGHMGIVRSISVRSTRIETFDRTDVIVPNSDLIAGQVTNWTRGNLVGRVIVPVGVAYGTDTRKVERVLMEIAEAHPMVVVAPPPAVIFQGFGTNSMNFEIRAILRDVNFLLSVRSDMNHEIARRFREEGIEIPLPQQHLWVRNPDGSLSEAGHPAEPRSRPAGPQQHLLGPEDMEPDDSDD